MNYLYKIDFKFLVIVLLVLVILFMKMCDSNQPKTPNGTINIDGKEHVILKHTTDTIYQPVIQTVYKKGEIIYRDTIIYIDTPKKIDTNEILKDYFANVIYKDTLKLTDGLGFITLIDTISKNRIKSRMFNSKVNKILIHDTIVVEPTKQVEFFGGGTMGFDKINLVNFVGPTLNIKTKNDNIYGVSLGINTYKSVTIQGTFLWKLKFKK